MLDTVADAPVFDHRDRAGDREYARQAGLSLSLVSAVTRAQQWPSFQALARLTLATGHRLAVFLPRDADGVGAFYVASESVRTPAATERQYAEQPDRIVRLWHDVAVEQLQVARKLSGLTQHDTGQRAQVDGRTVAQTEASVGTTRWFSLRVLLALTAALEGRLAPVPLTDPFPPPLWRPLGDSA
jgi:transcriptional regulator with XRE-family HTH domain